MKLWTFISLLFVAVLLLASRTECRYEPNWDSLDKRPLPQWYDDAKVGIFIHWGVFSVPSYVSEWFWNFWNNPNRDGGRVKKFMEDNFRPGFTYADFAKDFHAEFYDPVQWAKLFEASGAKYIVLTSKHHEGFTNWPSNVSFNWNAMDVGPRQDLVGKLADAIRQNTNLHFGLYHSLFEWYNPLYLDDQTHNFTKNRFVKYKTMPELIEIVNKFHPEVIWSDGDAAPDWYWNSTEFIAWLYNDSPVKDTVVTNDRWGNNNVSCHHGDFYTCADRYNPGHVLPHKWENCFTIDKSSWGYRRNIQMSDVLTIEEMVKEIVSTVSCNGNVLVNVGPTKEGIIAPIFQERLTQMGKWLGVNGPAIYESRPWKAQNDSLAKDTWYTTNKNQTKVFAVFLTWPDNNVLHLADHNVEPTDEFQVTMLGYNGSALDFDYQRNIISVELPISGFDASAPGWTLVLENFDQSENY